MDVVWRQAGLVAGVDGGVGGFEVAGEARRVEQGSGEAVVGELLAEGAEAGGNGHSQIQRFQRQYIQT